MSRILVMALALVVAAPAMAAEWVEYVSQEDRFGLTFPGQPTVTATTYKSEYGAELKARVHKFEENGARYTVTVVDYSPIEQILTDKAKSCPAGAETCLGSPTTGRGYWIVDKRGALLYAVWNFMQRDAKVTHLTWQFTNLVEGHQMQLTNNKDESRTYAAMFMHQDRLYILEATVPKGIPEPTFFQQSLAFLDAEGKSIRYTSVYSNFYTAPPRAR